jgi:hypothetical protein
MKYEEERVLNSSVKLHTWLANMYNSKLYAAPAQAVFVTTPVALII